MPVPVMERPATQRAPGSASVAAPLPPPTSPPSPQARPPVAGDGQQGALALLQYEAEIRRQATLQELQFHLANEMRRVLHFRQAFVLTLDGDAGTPRLQAVSSLATVEPGTPLARWACASVTGLQADAGLVAVRRFDAGAYAMPQEPSGAATCPFPCLMWLPLRDRGDRVIAGVLLADVQPWREADQVIADRLGSTYAHAWLALAPARPAARRLLRQRRWQVGAAVLALGVLALPVRLSALAPVEVGAARPMVLAAPLPGVIEAVHVAPHAVVKAGQPLLTYEATTLRNEQALAEQRLLVARARHLRAAQAAFGSSDASHETAIAKAELDLAQAEFQYATDRLNRTRLVAPIDGVAIYGDRRDLEGRPVEIGQPLLQVADPRQVEFRIELPARDGQVIADGAPVTVYLDSAPLQPIEARLVRSSYQARATAEKVLAFTLVAAPLSGVGAEALRIGSRGTAQVYGERVPLAYKMLRRPLAALRQGIGL